MSPAGGRGMALAAALLTLATVATLAFATALLAQLEWRVAQNRHSEARARFEARARLTTELLRLEELAVAAGELPATLPAAEGLSYLRLDPHSALLGVEVRAGRARAESEARVALEAGPEPLRLRLLERR